MAALTAKPCRSVRRTPVCIIAASPPNRWAQPVMSRNRPCGASSATSGVKRSHQSAMSFSGLASAASSASNTLNCGQMARALASGRPISRPRWAAASSSAEICSALFCLATTMLGASNSSGRLDASFQRGAITASTAFASWRWMRSVGRRGSHRLRIRRRFAEKALITFPFHDPSPNRAMTVANELRRRTPARPTHSKA